MLRQLIVLVQVVYAILIKVAGFKTIRLALKWLDGFETSWSGNWSTTYTCESSHQNKTMLHLKTQEKGELPQMGLEPTTL